MFLMGLAIIILLALLIAGQKNMSKGLSVDNNLKEYLEQKRASQDGSVNEVSKESKLGSEGEKTIFSELQRLPGQKKIYMNSYIPKENGGTSEIDLIMVSEYGVFVIESKNYGGVIKGNSVNQKWVQTFNNKSEFKFYNPILQNKSHIAALDNYLDLNIPNLYHSYVVFGDRCELSLQRVPIKHNVVKTVDLVSNITNYMKKNRKMLTQSQIVKIDNNLRTTVNVELKVKKKHIETIKNNKAYHSKPKKKTKTTNQVCPLCKSKLVVRVSSRGPGKQNKFYGCSNYPNCKFTKK